MPILVNTTDAGSDSGAAIPMIFANLFYFQEYTDPRKYLHTTARLGERKTPSITIASNPEDLIMKEVALI
jgi:hypothetical protein